MAGSFSLGSGHGDVLLKCSFHCPLHGLAFLVEGTPAAHALLRILWKIGSNKLGFFKRDAECVMTGLDSKYICGACLIYDKYILIKRKYQRHIK